EIVSAKNLP
ncbi:unnamed protein product, partial [Allacma fusca]